MKIKYSPEPIDELSRVVEFIENKNPYAARRIAIDLQEGVDRLKKFPEIGLPVLKASDPDKIRDLSIKYYTVRYLINNDIIYILRVWHNKENEKIYNKANQLYTFSKDQAVNETAVIINITIPART